MQRRLQCFIRASHPIPAEIECNVCESQSFELFDDFPATPDDFFKGVRLDLDTREVSVMTNAKLPFRNRAENMLRFFDLREPFGRQRQAVFDAGGEAGGTGLVSDGKSPFLCLPADVRLGPAAFDERRNHYWRKLLYCVHAGTVIVFRVAEIRVVSRAHLAGFFSEDGSHVLAGIGAEEEGTQNAGMPAYISALKKGDPMQCRDLEIREGETKPPKRYNSGSMILAMENAGQLIEEEELREQIRGSGIGTSATRAEILKKLFGNQYLKLNSKTQIITPTLLGEMIYDTVYCSIRSLLNPKLTASWELGLTRVAEGTVTEAEYLEKLNGFVTRNTDHVKNSSYGGALRGMFERDRQFYKTPVKNTSSRYRKRNSDNKHKEKAGKKE